MVFIIALGTTNAFMAATSRLGYALARDGAFPAWLEPLNRQGVPTRVILLVSAYALGGFALVYVVGGRAETLLFIPNSLGIATFIVGTAAGVRLLKAKGRYLTPLSFLLSIAASPLPTASVFLPI